MARDLTKYLHGDMNKEAGKEHSSQRTKIVSTVGPACDTYEKLLELVKSGVNIFIEKIIIYIRGKEAYISNAYKIQEKMRESPNPFV